MVTCKRLPIHILDISGYILYEYYIFHNVTNIDAQ